MEKLIDVVDDYYDDIDDLYLHFYEYSKGEMDFDFICSNLGLEIGYIKRLLNTKELKELKFIVQMAISYLL